MWLEVCNRNCSLRNWNTRKARQRTFYAYLVFSFGSLLMTHSMPSRRDGWQYIFRPFPYCIYRCLHKSSLSSVYLRDASSPTGHTNLVARLVIISILCTGASSMMPHFYICSFACNQNPTEFITLVTWWLFHILHTGVTKIEMQPY